MLGDSFSILFDLFFFLNSIEMSFDLFLCLMSIISMFDSHNM